jgi:hypothetical protein
MSEKTNLLEYLIKHQKELKKKRDEFNIHLVLKEPNWEKLLSEYASITVDIKNTERKIFYATYNKGYLGNPDKTLTIPKNI